MLTLEELHAHYKAVRARIDNAPKKKPAVRLIYPEPGPYPDPLYIPAPEHDTIEAAKEAPAKSIATRLDTPAQKILSEVALKHGMPPTTFRSKSRDAAYILCRQEAAYRLKHELKFSLSQIGHLMGHRDHTTVLNAISRYKKNLALGGEPWTRSSVSDACDTEASTQAQTDHG